MHSQLASPNATLEVLQRFGLHTKKALGQHFLVDDNVISRIGDLAQVEPSDTILEIGPGIGTLTIAMLGEGAEVIAVERDSQLIPVLMDDCAKVVDPGDNRFAVVEMDALELEEHNLQQVCDGLARKSLPKKLVSNLPYAVAATLVLDCIRRFPSIQSMTIMVQHEVAMRMCAEPGTKDYGAYSVKLAMFASTGDSFPVSPRSFLPPPRVDSRVIRLGRRTDIADTKLLDAACMSADAAFSQRRKTIRNSMRSYFAAREMNPDMADELISAAGVDPGSRGESHPPEIYLAMGQMLANLL